MDAIAELVLDLLPGNEKVSARIFPPVEDVPGETWACRIEIGAPFHSTSDIKGSTSLQALALALQNLSAELYGSAEYKSGRLGIFGEFGGYLTIPASHVILDIAPFPF